jgi:ADP-ribosylglycohydrolase
MSNTCERFVGTLLGGCIGDILGSTNEGKTFDSIRANKIQTTFINNYYTDDTELTLVLAKYLAEYHNTPHSITQQVHQMYHDVVKNSNRGYSQKTKKLLSNWTHSMLGGTADTNGAIMRIAPMAFVNYKSDEDLYTKLRYVLYCTHGENKDAVDMAFIHVKLLIGIISKKYNTADSLYEYAKKLAKRVRNPIFHTYLISMHPDNRKRFEKTNWNVTKTLFGYDLFQIKATECLICALVCYFYNYNNPKEALIMAANIGGDTDTIAKLVGDLMGATHGTSWIPKEWQNPEGKDELINVATALYNKLS